MKLPFGFNIFLDTLTSITRKKLINLLKQDQDNKETSCDIVKQTAKQNDKEMQYIYLAFDLLTFFKMTCHKMSVCSYN